MISRWTITVALCSCLFSIGLSQAAMAKPAMFTLSKEGGFPDRFSVEGGLSNFETTGKWMIDCTKLKGAGEFTSSLLGKATLDFEECGLIVGGFKFSCETLGDNEGIFLMHVDFHLVALRDAGGNLEAGMAVIFPKVELECSAFEFRGQLRGAATGLVTPFSKELEEANEGLSAIVALKQTGGKQITDKCVEEVSDCEKLAKEPLETNLIGEFESVGVNLSLGLVFNKMMQIVA